MTTEWKEYVQKEYIKADNEFVEKLPLNSIDLSTFGLINEATSFVPVRAEGEVHLKPLPGGLSSLKKDIKDSPRPGGDFDLDSAIGTLTKFGEEWEGKIKEENKWDKMLELAEKENHIIDEDEYEEESSTETSFLERVRDIFT